MRVLVVTTCISFLCRADSFRCPRVGFVRAPQSTILSKHVCQPPTTAAGTNNTPQDFSSRNDFMRRTLLRLEARRTAGDAPESPELLEDLRTVIGYRFNLIGVFQVFVHHLGWMGLAAGVAWVLRTPKLGLAGFVMNRKALLIGSLSSLPLFLYGTIVSLIYEKVIRRINSDEMSTEQFTLALLGGVFRPIPALLASIGMGFMAGLSEEHVFRGVLQYELARRLGNWIPMRMCSFTAVMITSSIFAALHTQYTAIQTFEIGLFSAYMGWLYNHAGGNLAVPVLAHALYDIAIFFTSHIEVAKLTVEEQVRLNHGVLVVER